jgi:AraC family transcriptional regulator
MSRYEESPRLSRGEHYGRVVTHRETAGLRLTELHHSRAELLPEHTHECAHFWLFLSGTFQDHLGSKVRPYRPFSFGYYPADLEQRDEFGRDGARFFTIELDAHWAQMVADLNRPMSAEPVDVHDTRGFRAMLQLHSKFLRARDGGYDVDCFAAESLTAELIGYAFEPCSRSQQRQPRWLRPVMQFLDECYTRPFRISALAACAGVHPVHLARVFREVHRCSVAQYLTALRIRRACSLIGMSDFTLSQIALQTGFADQSHFTRAFTATTGCPPGEFRRTVFPRVRADELSDALRHVPEYVDRVRTDRSA